MKVNIGFEEVWKRELSMDNAVNVLVGVSGGVDSVVLCHVLSRYGVSFGIAHCNFSLRSEESDGDEAFVRSLASHYEVPFFTQRFETQQEAQRSGSSIQMAARDLRFNWFEEVRRREGYHYIVVGTHLTDSIETFFINLIRGTGLSGLSGIRYQQGNVIRPLLTVSREDIYTYAKANQLEWREDSSNADIKYLRNNIRHTLLPGLTAIRNDFSDVMLENIQRLRQTEMLMEDYMDLLSAKLMIRKGDHIHLGIEDLLREKHPSALVYPLLKPYGFNASVCQDIWTSISGTTGKEFCSPTHQITLDRGRLILSTRKEEVLYTEYSIEEGQKKIEAPLQLTFTVCDAKEYQLIRSSETASLDWDKLTFPLTLRRWKNGDVFYPLGMHGKKKVSDFLIDTKVSLPEKKNTWVLTSESQIVWIIGHRVDNRFKLENESKKVYLIAPFS